MGNPPDLRPFPHGDHSFYASYKTKFINEKLCRINWEYPTSPPNRYNDVDKRDSDSFIFRGIVI
jgi:hypothetical protein